MVSTVQNTLIPYYTALCCKKGIWTVKPECRFSFHSGNQGFLVGVIFPLRTSWVVTTVGWVLLASSWVEARRLLVLPPCAGKCLALNSIVMQWRNLSLVNLGLSFSICNN